METIDGRFVDFRVSISPRRRVCNRVASAPPRRFSEDPVSPAKISIVVYDPLAPTWIAFRRTLGFYGFAGKSSPEVCILARARRRTRKIASRTATRGARIAGRAPRFPPRVFANRANYGYRVLSVMNQLARSTKRFSDRPFARVRSYSLVFRGSAIVRLRMKHASRRARPRAVIAVKSSSVSRKGVRSRQNMFSLAARIGTDSR